MMYPETDGIEFLRKYVHYYFSKKGEVS